MCLYVLHEYSLVLDSELNFLFKKEKDKLNNETIGFIAVG